MTMPPAQTEIRPRGTHVIAIASGQDGAGKSSIVLNLAVALAARGRNVCLLDADFGATNAHTLLGEHPATNLEEVLFSNLPMEKAAAPVRPNLDLIAGSSGVARLVELDAERRAALTTQFALLRRYDYLLVDTAPGISPLVVSLCLGCEEVVMVFNPDASSVRDAYALIKVLKENGLARPPLAIINQCASEAQARAVSAKFDETTRRFLSLPCLFLGAVPEDEALPRAAALHTPLVEAAPESAAARALQAVAGDLESYLLGGRAASAEPELFFKRASLGLLKGQALLSKVMELDSDGMRVELKRVDAALERLAGDPQAAHLADDILMARAAISKAQEQECSASEQAAPERNAAEQSHAPQAVVVCADMDLLEVLVDVTLEAGVGIRSAVSSASMAERMLKGAELLIVSTGDSVQEESALARLLAAARELPVIFIEGFAGRSIVAQRHAQQFAAILPRPFHVEALLEAIRRVSQPLGASRHIA